jgi:hypothetical protein
MKRRSILVILVLSCLSFANSDPGAAPMVPEGYSVRFVAANLGRFPQALDVASDGSIYLVNIDGPVYRVSPDGTVGAISGPFSDELMQGIVVARNGNVYTSSTRSVFRLSPGTTTFTLLSDNPTRFNATDICGDLAIREPSLYMVGQSQSFPPLWLIDPMTGAFVEFETSPSWSFSALAYDAARDLLIGAGESGLFEIDPAEGSAKMFSFSAPGEPVTKTFIDCNTGQETTVSVNPSRSVGQATVQPTTGDVYFTTLNANEIIRATRAGEVFVFSPEFSPLAGLGSALGIGFNDAGDKLYITDRGALYEITGDFVSIPCAVAYAFNSVSTDGEGQSESVNGSLRLTFEGPVATTRGLVDRGRNRVQICPNSLVTFEAESDTGAASCEVNGVPTGNMGAVSSGDTLVCTNKPYGQDTDRFVITTIGSR